MRKILFLIPCMLCLSIVSACEQVDWDAVSAGEGGDMDNPSDSSDYNGGHLGWEEGKGSFAEPFGIAEARNDTLPDSLQCWVCGYVVGYTKNGTMKNAVFNADSASASNIIIADAADETDYAQCMPVELSTTQLKKALSLQYNPDSLGRKVAIFGMLRTYYYVRGLRSVREYEWRGE